MVWFSSSAKVSAVEYDRIKFKVRIEEMNKNISDLAEQYKEAEEERKVAISKAGGDEEAAGSPLRPWEDLQGKRDRISAKLVYAIRQRDVVPASRLCYRSC